MYVEWVQGFAIVGCLCSLSVMVSFLAFPPMRSRIFFQIISIVAACDFIGNLAFAFGFPPGGSSLCLTQGILVVFFFPASWLWTVLLCFCLRGVVINSRIPLSPRALHFIGWSIPAICTFVPLSSQTYSRFDDEVGFCFFSPLSGTPVVEDVFWIFFSFSALLFTYVFILVVWSVELWLRLAHSKAFGNHLSSLIRMSYEAMNLYPTAFILAWLPNALFQFFVTDVKHPDILLTVGLCCATTQSFMCAVIFFVNSAEVRLRWRHLIKQTLHSVLGYQQKQEFEGGRSSSANPSSVNLMASFSTVSTAYVGSEEVPKDFPISYETMERTMSDEPRESSIQISNLH